MNAAIAIMVLILGIPVSLLGGFLFATWMEKRNSVGRAMKCLEKALKEDPGYRITWHANLSCQIYDGTRRAENISWQRADHIANKILEHFFNA